MTNSIVLGLLLPLLVHAICAHQTLGLSSIIKSLGMTSIWPSISSSHSTSATANVLGCIWMECYSARACPSRVSSSSKMSSSSTVNYFVSFLVQDIPIQYGIVKSLQSITDLVWCLHTIKVWAEVQFLMLKVHTMVPRVFISVPLAVQTLGSWLVFIFSRPNNL